MRDLLWHPDAWNDYMEMQSDKMLLKKANRLLNGIMRNGYQCAYGKVEMLKGDFKGFASVRIDHKNRIIFSADDNNVTIVQCGGHYHDN